jgi:hypothetical protein
MRRSKCPDSPDGVSADMAADTLSLYRECPSAVRPPKERITMKAQGFYSTTAGSGNSCRCHKQAKLPHLPGGRHGVFCSDCPGCGLLAQYRLSDGFIPPAVVLSRLARKGWAV